MKYFIMILVFSGIIGGLNLFMPKYEVPKLQHGQEQKNLLTPEPPSLPPTHPTGDITPEPATLPPSPKG